MNWFSKKTKIMLRVRQKLCASCLVFMAVGLPISGCAQIRPEAIVGPAKQEVVPASMPPTTPIVTSGVPERMSFEQKYAVEIAMGADCPKARLGSGWGGVISDGACTAQLPSYFTPMMEMLSVQSVTLLHKAANQHIFKPVDNKFYIRAVPGFGARPDILVRLAGDAWVRSFEGTDPAMTMYLVRAHFACNAHELRAAKKMGRFAMQLCEDPMEVLRYELREDDPALRLRLFRVKNEGAPEDVTATLLPTLPSLTMAERKRYYKHGVGGVDDKGHSTLPDDTHLLMATNRLQYVPTLRWWLPLDPDLPLPNTDPRGPGREAHFGFLIWTGKRFEMRQRVPRSFVPCGVGDDGTIYRCIPGTDPYARQDRFIIEAK